MAFFVTSCKSTNIFSSLYISFYDNQEEFMQYCLFLRLASLSDRENRGSGILSTFSFDILLLALSLSIQALPKLNDLGECIYNKPSWKSYLHVCMLRLLCITSKMKLAGKLWLTQYLMFLSGAFQFFVQLSA